MKATRHRPNVIPLNTRVALAVAAVFLIIYMCAAVATGYTYLPGKRGGFLLSGFPTLLLVIAASGLFLASLLTIVDHYDIRPNEASYAALRKYSLRAALYLFIAAPFIEILQRLLLLWNIEVLPPIHGLAEHATFYSPRFNQFAGYIEPVTNNGLLIALLVVITGGLGLLIDKHSSKFKRVVAILISISMFGLSTQLLAGSTRDFLTGEVKAGKRAHKYMVRAEQEPAKFNAILLTDFAMGSIMFTASTFVLIGVITDRLKTPVRTTRSNKRFQTDVTRPLDE